MAQASLEFCIYIRLAANSQQSSCFRLSSTGSLHIFILMSLGEVVETDVEVFLSVG